jgi:hypothetical protein
MVDSPVVRKCLAICCSMVVDIIVSEKLSTSIKEIVVKIPSAAIPATDIVKDCRSIIATRNFSCCCSKQHRGSVGMVQAIHIVVVPFFTSLCDSYHPFWTCNVFEAYRTGNFFPSLFNPKTLILISFVDCGLTAVKKAFVVLYTVASSLGLISDPDLT